MINLETLKMESVLIEIHIVADKESHKLDTWAKTGMRKGRKWVGGEAALLPI